MNARTLIVTAACHQKRRAGGSTGDVATDIGKCSRGAEHNRTPPEQGDLLIEPRLAGVTGYRLFPLLGPEIGGALVDVLERGDL